MITSLFKKKQNDSCDIFLVIKSSLDDTVQGKQVLSQKASLWCRWTGCGSEPISETVAQGSLFSNSEQTNFRNASLFSISNSKLPLKRAIFIFDDEVSNYFT